MPLRDHFRPPLSRRRQWDMLHGGWPMKIVEHLMRILPPQYAAAPGVHLGSPCEVDVATIKEGEPRFGFEGGGTATAVYSPPKPTLETQVINPDYDEYEVKVFDIERDWILVAAIEIVSPGNKDSPAARKAFVQKCHGLLKQDVSVIIVDLVTTRRASLYRDLLKALNKSSPPESEPLYIAAFRAIAYSKPMLVQSWHRPLEIGAPLPELPLWLNEDLAIPLDFEPSYEETCRVLRM